MLVGAIANCGNVAMRAPGEMAKAEWESREQEGLNGCPPSYGDQDISQEGRISLPTSPASLVRLSLGYNEAALSVCVAALADVGGRDTPAGDDGRRVP